MIDVGRDLERLRDYVAGRLSDADQRAFEDRLAREPELVRELELSQRLREGLERLRDGGELPARVRGRVHRSLPWAAGLAAMIAGVTLLLWLQPAAHLHPLQLSATAPAGETAASFTFITMRGPAASPVLELPARGIVELRASRPDGPPGSRYRITLARVDAGSAAPGAALGGIEGSADGLVHAYVDAAAVTAGAYELRVQSDGSSAAAEVFGFTLRNATR